MNLYYILNDKHQPVPVSSLDEVVKWAASHPDIDLVAYDVIGDWKLSTRFFGTADLNTGKPVFETYLIDAPLHYRKRYGNWNDAATGHQRVLEALKLLRDTEPD